MYGMDIPNWINIMELVIAVLLITHLIGNFPNFVITILGVILMVDVLIDIMGS